MPPDFRDMLRIFSAEKIDYLLVGAYAMAAHGCPRATGDIDFWVRPTIANARIVFRALTNFGAPLGTVVVEDFARPGNVYQVGIQPLRIDILTSISGVEFDDAWPNRTVVEMEGLPVVVIGRDDLLTNKKSTGRLKDIADAAILEKQKRRRHP